MAFAIRPRQRVLFTGDSITDCGRRDRAAPYGEGYVRDIITLILGKYPRHDCTYVNTGIGGNVLEDLWTRFTDDVIHHQPDLVSVLIGINDLNSCLNRRADRKVDPQSYADFYQKACERLKKESKATLVLMDPFYMSRDQDSESYRTRVLTLLPEYQAVVQRMARSFDAYHVRTQAMFEVQMARHPADRFGGEPVHPNAVGHLLIAHEWLKTAGW